MLQYLLVWVLIVSKHNYAGFAAQLGPYSDLESCQRVQANLVEHLYSRCVQVNIPK